MQNPEGINAELVGDGGALTAGKFSHPPWLGDEPVSTRYDSDVIYKWSLAGGENPKRTEVCSPEDCAVSMVSVFELFAGVFRCNNPENEGQKVSTFLEPFHLLPFDWDAALKTAEIQFQLEKADLLPLPNFFAEKSRCSS